MSDLSCMKTGSSDYGIEYRTDLHHVYIRDLDTNPIRCIFYDELNRKITLAFLLCP